MLFPPMGVGSCGLGPWVKNGTSSITGAALWPASRFRKRMSSEEDRGPGRWRDSRSRMPACSRLAVSCCGMVASESGACDTRSTQSSREQWGPAKRSQRAGATSILLQAERHGADINCEPLSRGSWVVKGRCRSSVERHAQSLASAWVACVSAYKRERSRHGESDSDDPFQPFAGSPNGRPPAIGLLAPTAVCRGSAGSSLVLGRLSYRRSAWGSWT